MNATALERHDLQATPGEHGFAWSHRVKDRIRAAIWVADACGGIQRLGARTAFGAMSRSLRKT